MPTTNKRINLTIPDQLYERIQAYKQKNGITSDASACLQLVKRQLDTIDHDDMMMKMVSKFSLEELQNISNMGLTVVKAFMDNQEQLNGKDE